MEEGKDIQDYLKKKTGQKTVPNIFISRFTPLIYLAFFSFMLLQTKNTSVVCWAHVLFAWAWSIHADTYRQ
jgi:hypothetical protein